MRIEKEEHCIRTIFFESCYIYQVYYVCQLCIEVVTVFICFFDSVSDLLDYISPDHDPKGGDGQKKHRRSKVSNKLFMIMLTSFMIIAPNLFVRSDNFYINLNVSVWFFR